MEKLNKSDDCSTSAVVTLHMSVEEYLQFLKEKEEGHVAKESPPKRYIYGLKGLQELFGCSTTTAWRIKNLPWMRPAITQVGRKIIVDVDMVMSLIKESGNEISNSHISSCNSKYHK